MTSKLATFKIEENIWQAFQEKAKGDRTNASALLKSFIGAYLKGRVEIDQYQNIDTIEGIDQRIEKLIEAALEPVLKNVEALEKKLTV